MKEIQAIVQALLDPATGEAVLATLLTVEGSSYRRPGARLLVKADGTRLGSISGGCLEEDLLVRAKKVFATGIAEPVVYDTTSENDLVWGVGLGCHGVVRILVEKVPPQPAWARVLAENFAARRPTALGIVHGAAGPGRGNAGHARGAFELGTYLADAAPRGAEVHQEIVPPPTALIVYGAGDDAQPLARLAKELGWHVTIADPRAAFNTPARFPTADAWVVAPSPELVARTAPGANHLAVVMTHHYVHDVPILRALAGRPLAYVGLLGPRKRADKMLADLTAEGVAFPPAWREKLYAPVGLDLGADAPEQVALAIIAEMQAVLAGRDGRSLRERMKPIHG